MQLNKTKWIVVTVACCIAILQALQPLIHVHLDGDHLSHADGMHMVESHEYAHAIEHTDNHVVSDGSDLTHTIAVPSAIKQDQPTKFMIDVFALILVCFWFALVLAPSSRYLSQFTLISSSALRRRLPAPRAPPLY